MDDIHAGSSGTFNKTLHIIDKNGFFRQETDLFQDAAINHEVRFASPHFMRREYFFDMAEDLELLLDMREMERVGV